MATAVWWLIFSIACSTVIPFAVFCYFSVRLSIAWFNWVRVPLKQKRYWKVFSLRAFSVDVPTAKALWWNSFKAWLVFCFLIVAILVVGMPLFLYFSRH